MGHFWTRNLAKSVLSQRNSNVHCHTARVELNWSISVGISTCEWPSIILKYWNAQGHTGFWCSLHSVHCRNPLFGIWNSSLHVHSTQGAGADTVWGCICVLPVWGGQGIQILIHWIHSHFVFPVRTVCIECFGMIKLMCLASDVFMVTVVSESDLQT